MHSVLESNNESGEKRKQDEIVAIINQRLGVPMSTFSDVRLGQQSKTGIKCKQKTLKFQVK